MFPSVSSVCVVVFMSLPQTILSACQVYKQKAPVGKQATLDCLYGDNVRIPYGATHLDREKCLECTCPLSGPLQCCNIDHSPSVVKVEGCVAREINCQTVLVDALDESKPCSQVTRQSSLAVYNNEETTESSNSIGSRRPEARYRFGGNGATSLTADEYMFLLEIALSILMQRDM